MQNNKDYGLKFDPITGDYVVVLKADTDTKEEQTNQPKQEKKRPFFSFFSIFNQPQKQAAPKTSGFISKIEDERKASDETQKLEETLIDEFEKNSNNDVLNVEEGLENLQKELLESDLLKENVDLIKNDRKNNKNNGMLKEKDIYDLERELLGDNAKSLRELEGVEAGEPLPPANDNGRQNQRLGEYGFPVDERQVQPNLNNNRPIARNPNNDGVTTPNLPPNTPDNPPRPTPTPVPIPPQLPPFQPPLPPFQPPRPPRPPRPPQPPIFPPPQPMFEAIRLTALLYNKFRILNQIYQVLDSIGQNYDFSNMITQNIIVQGALLNIYRSLSGSNIPPRQTLRVPPLGNTLCSGVRVANRYLQTMIDDNIRLQRLISVPSIDRQLQIIGAVMNSQKGILNDIIIDCNRPSNLDVN